MSPVLAASASRLAFLFVAIVSTAALGLGCSEPRSATGSTEPLAPTRPPARASAQAHGGAAAPGPWASAGSATPAPADASAQAAAAARAARQQAQINAFAKNTGRAGLLLREGDQDALVPGPILGTEIEISVTGPIARVKVRQRFQNPSLAWVEGIYIFPLPGDAAVDRMRVVTDRSTLEGEIQEKKKAEATYVKARAEGKQAGLVEWQAPNLFSTAVANIEPGGEVVVEIEYQQSLAPDSGVWSLRFPLARRRPEDAAALLAKSSSSSLPAASDGFSPPSPSPRYPARIRVDLAPGFPSSVPTSPYHAIRATPHGAGYAVELARGEVEAERDFVLNWRALPGKAPGAALFQENWGGRHQALLVLTPPHADGPPAPGLAREIVFVVDTSGSMSGTSIDQARRALRAGVDRLTPDDRFNLLAFSSETRGLFDQPVAATPGARRQALEFIAGLEAKGSTEMEPALELALDPAGSAGDRMRQVVFITDGGVSRPGALYARIQDWAGESRIFMVGIGSAPSGHFMRKAARYGRGTYTAIGDPSEVADVMQGLFGKLDSVVLSEIELELPSGVRAEIHPARIGDLYRGEPLVVAIESDRPLAWLGVQGRAGAAPWRVTLDGRDAEQRPGVHVLFARRKMEALLDGIRSQGDPGGKLASVVTALALDHHLVSPYTSLVAVERIARRRDNERWVQKNVEGPRPSAFAPQRMSIRFGKGATPAALQMALGAAGLAAAGWVARLRRRQP